ncbi:Mini-chromosome maintenance complex-binding protein [Camellia lanceoleosa]|uniref:Mini-chromosome maintenance complex-binding protein n=1 Tax=Camellia lanceoleosa TaxID=1840588 RepID=A0ACC0IA79_9ERIC|nr:Mini-chromosome maintenance complex-binding protein [Camellia lanceoleosa]
MVYDSLEADLKLNDVFEFVGVLTFDLEPSVDKDDSDEFTSTLCEDELSHSPPSKVLNIYFVCRYFVQGTRPVLIVTVL